MFKALKMFTYAGKTFQAGDLIESLPQRLVNLGMVVAVADKKVEKKAKAQESQVLTEDVKPVENVLVEDSSDVEVVKESKAPVSPVASAVKPIKNIKKK